MYNENKNKSDKQILGIDNVPIDNHFVIYAYSKTRIEKLIYIYLRGRKQKAIKPPRWTYLKDNIWSWTSWEDSHILKLLRNLHHGRVIHPNKHKCKEGKVTYFLFLFVGSTWFFPQIIESWDSCLDHTKVSIWFWLWNWWEIMFTIRCWPTTFCIIIGEDAEGQCQKWLVWSTLWCLGIFVGIIGQHPSVSKSNRLHATIFYLFFINFRTISQFL